MSIKFVIDSASDILPEEAKRLGAVHLPLTIRFGDTEYFDGVNLSHKEFYEKLIESNTLPTTSQINPAMFEETFEKLVNEGHTVIAITLSSKLSGTYQSAIIAAQEYKDKVFVVDSENVCVGERVLILRGIELLKEGLSAKDIVDKLNEEKKNIKVLGLLDTLEYLKKGGRISAAAAFAGGILSIKPVITVKDGVVELVGKARGSKQGNNLLREMIAKTGIDFNKPLSLGYSGLSDELLQKYIKDSESLWQGQADELRISTVGATIGTHVGPGAIAIAFFVS